MKISSKLSGEIRIARSKSDVRSWYDSVRSEFPGSVIGFVPTMGALHKGHETLIESASTRCDRVVVSIFVNPTQFGPGEDLDKYPRTFEADLEICKRHGVDLVFSPEPAELYQTGTEALTVIEPPRELIERLCGLSRPGHFCGVATVVAKLFNIVRPDKAYFGEKDFQQLQVVKRMVRDLDIPVEIVPVPTVRDHDGLALSSRNAYLSEEQRAIAPRLQAGLVRIGELVRGQEKLALSEAIDLVRVDLSENGGFNIDYLEVCDCDTLEPLVEAPADRKIVILIAAKLGAVRLIDNLVV
ncbi:MAG: pantoate--beta-alanine ligase [Candidatus Obscuribacterales bacterium]|nr:pantoate--beta-alanine ligase [Cyanobacteria bacterium HKST-UBA01]MCB9467159.1 pantoate--beta-alanine ligase [Candidatus Obscuribacterales bacterium]